MTQNIGMNVTATFNPSAVTQGIQQINQQINQVNQHPINPVSPQAGQQLDALNKRFQQLLKVDAELRRRIKATGQEGKLFEQIDWNATHPNQVARRRKINSINEYLGIGGSGGAGGGGPPLPPGPHAPPPAPPPGSHGPGPVASFAVGAVQSGLRAAGPAGGVAAGALGTGMSAGVGAGLMGLVGGLAALGIGKVVSGVMEKVGQAEDNDVAYDKLKRTLGDVNVSFNALKSVVMDGASNLKITYAEFGALSSQFAKAGNLKDDQFASLPDEIGVGVGMSRAFGMDPGQGVGVMGQMRGMGVTSNVQESRKFALLIGETIGKSGAFAKADEVMEAMSTYAMTQTRNSMGGANMSGYGGMFSSMVGSGIAGMDAAGASSMLARINSSLSAGGAKGEASQFFTGMVGNRMGLDPLQTQVMREGGAFATNNRMFGDNSAYARYMGHTGPKGDKTFLQGTIETLNQQYGGTSDDAKLMRAQAFANHTGINMNQSMAMLSLKPNEMGQMEKYAGDLTKLNAGGIGNLAKVVTGTDADRRGVADSLLRRNDVTSEEKGRINDTMKNGSTEEQKQLLASLVASRNQEQTTGSDIRDSKNSLDNIKTALADKLVPVALEMRHGIMAIAGVGRGKSSEDIMKGVIDADSDARMKAKLGKGRTENAELEERKSDLENRRRALDPVNLAVTYRDKPEVLEQKMKERASVLSDLNAVDKRLKEITEEQENIIKEENRRKEKELSALRANNEARWEIEDAAGVPRSGGGTSGGNTATLQSKTASNFPEIQNDDQRKNVKTMLDIIAASEGANYNTLVGGGKIDDLSQHPNKVGLRTADGPSTAAGRYQITNTTWKGVSNKLGLTDFSPESQDKAAVELLKQRGAWNDVLKGDYHAAIGKLGSEWVSLPSSTNTNQGKRSWSFVDDAASKSKLAMAGETPMPAGAGAGRGDDPMKFIMKTEDVTIHLKDLATGKPLAEPQKIQTKVKPAGQSLVFK